MFIYDFRHAKDPFGLETFYSKNQSRPFIDGHKHDLEMLLVYVDCNDWTQFKWQKQALREYTERYLKKGETVNYKEATAHELGSRWKYLIDEHPDDSRWKTWKDEFIKGNIDGTLRTFLAVIGDKIELAKLR